LFEDPFRYSDPRQQDAQWNHSSHLQSAREIASKSMVLLKNENQVLPLSKQNIRIACIGPFVKSVRDHLGFWSIEWPDDSSRIVTLWDGINRKLSKGSAALYAKGCNTNDTDTSGFAEAKRVALQSDIVVLTVGEERNMSGESKSRSSLRLPGVQEQLIKATYQNCLYRPFCKVCS